MRRGSRGSTSTSQPRTLHAISPGCRPLKSAMYAPSPRTNNFCGYAGEALKRSAVFAAGPEAETGCGLEESSPQLVPSSSELNQPCEFLASRECGRTGLRAISHSVRYGKVPIGCQGAGLGALQGKDGACAISPAAPAFAAPAFASPAFAAPAFAAPASGAPA